MASVNVSEDEFFLVANAANRAQDMGDKKAAQGLDKLARKMNAALSVSSTTRTMGKWIRSLKSDALSWRDVDSVLEKP